MWTPSQASKQLMLSFAGVAGLLWLLVEIRTRTRWYPRVWTEIQKSCVFRKHISPVVKQEGRTRLCTAQTQTHPAWVTIFIFPVCAVTQHVPSDQQSWTILKTSFLVSEPVPSTTSVQHTRHYQGPCCCCCVVACLSKAWKSGDRTSLWWTFPSTIMSPLRPSDRRTDTSCCRVTWIMTEQDWLSCPAS